MSAGDREAEAQNKKAEEGSAPERDSRAAALVKQYWCTGLRAVELGLAVIAIGLIASALYAPGVVKGDHTHIALIYSAYSSFIIITGVLILARLFDETIGWKTSIAFSIIGCIMFTAAAAVIFYDVDVMNGWQTHHFYDDWHKSYYANARPNKQYYDLFIASGVFAVINAAVFLAHAFFTCRKEGEFE